MQSQKRGRQESEDWRGSAGSSNNNDDDVDDDDVDDEGNGSEGTNVDNSNNGASNSKKHKKNRRKSKKNKKNKPDSRPQQKKVTPSDKKRADRRKALFGPDKQTKEKSKIWYMRDLNPHSRCYPNEIAMSDLPFCRVLKPSAPRMKYFEREDKDRSVLHWGQRKLLFSEIEFLTLYGRKNTIVLYAGAAPGNHTEYLSSLFPEVSFVLVDPNDFTAQPSDKLAIRQQLFDDAIAVEFSSKPDVLFVSDIRSANHNTMDQKQFEQRLIEDNEAQKRWHQLLRPRYSMLKLRLPYGKGQSVYLDGDIYLPVWGPQSTTETRLICETDAKERVYDHNEYEEQMFHFNTTTRMSCFPHNVFAEGIDHCYDCTSEIFILRQYLLKFTSWLWPGQVEHYGPFDWEHPNFPAAPTPVDSSSSTFSSTSTSSTSSTLPTDSVTSTSTFSVSPSKSTISKAEEFESLLNRQVGLMSEEISTHIANGRTLACQVQVRHGKGGWGFHDQKISKLLKPVKT